VVDELRRQRDDMQENNSGLEEDETQLQYISDDEHRTVLDYEDEDSDAE
jgi:hypothetical protein